MDKHGILKAICKHDEIIYIDLKAINKKNIEGAKIFKYLFKLTDDIPFKNEKMDKDKNGNVTILKGLNIYTYEWFSLYQFLKHGEILYDPYRVSQLFAKLNDAMSVNNKLGGFPVFEEYYLKAMGHKGEQYNPSSPDEDYLDKYVWDGYLNFAAWSEGNWRETHHTTQNWSLTKIEPQMRDGEQHRFYWYRKLKR